MAALSHSGVAACAWQSGTQKIGDDKYQVSANASPAAAGRRARARWADARRGRQRRSTLPV